MLVRRLIAVLLLLALIGDMSSATAVQAAPTSLDLPRQNELGFLPIQGESPPLAPQAANFDATAISTANHSALLAQSNAPAAMPEKTGITLTRVVQGRRVDGMLLPSYLANSVQIAGEVRRTALSSGSTEAQYLPIYPGDGVQVVAAIFNIVGTTIQPPCNWTVGHSPSPTITISLTTSSGSNGCMAQPFVQTTTSTPTGPYAIPLSVVDRAGNHGNFLMTFTVVPPNDPIPTIERPCACPNTTGGNPVDFADGEDRYSYTDISMEGPFGLSFERMYANLTIGTSDMGNHWQHNYNMQLNRSIFPGVVIAYDPSGLPLYFNAPGAGTTQFDNTSGMSLALNSAGTTYTLKNFGNQQWSFNANGLLIGATDRHGNVQTVVHDTTSGRNNRISNVSDPLGHELCFFYDTQNRITAVSWLAAGACPSTVPTTGTVVRMTYDFGTGCASGELCSVTEPDGKTWTYHYLNDGTVNFSPNLTQVIDPLGDPTETNTYQFDHVVSQQTGKCSGTSPCADTGGVLNISYPPGAIGSGTPGGQVAVTDGQNRTTYYNVDPKSLMLTSISGPLCKCGGDQTRSYSYDGASRLRSVTDDAIGNGTHHTINYAYGRDSGGAAYPGPTSISEQVDVVGTTRTTTLQYYPIGDPRQDLPNVTTKPSVNFLGQTMATTDTYDTAGDLTARSTSGYAHGIRTTYATSNAFDARGRVLTTVGPRQTTTFNQTTKFGYFPDTDGDRLRAGQLATVTDPLNHSTQYAATSNLSSYTPFGSPLSMTDPNGVATEYTYDARGRMVSSAVVGTPAHPTSYITKTAYDAAGRVVGVTQPLGNGTVLAYDTSSRLSSLTRIDASGAQHERANYTYDTADDISTKNYQGCATPSSTCPSWTQSWSQTYFYDAQFANLTKTTNADNTVQSFSYSPQGKMATFNDENHPSPATDVTDTYDLAGRRLSEIHVLAGAPNVVTAYTYDLHDNVASVTDPNGNVTRYTYDDFDRLESETSPVSGITTYHYDEAGNLVAKVAGNGNTAAYVYDALDRLTAETDDVPNDSTGAFAEKFQFSYDDPTIGKFAIGRLATMTDPTGSTKYAYDVRGLVETEDHLVTNGSSTQNEFITSYRYDANGNRQQVAYPDNLLVGYGYDFADRPYSAQKAATLIPSASTRVSSALAAGLEMRSAMSAATVGTGEPAVPFPRYRPQSYAMPASEKLGGGIANRSFGMMTPWQPQSASGVADAPGNTAMPQAITNIIVSRSTVIGGPRRTGENTGVVLTMPGSGAMRKSPSTPAAAPMQTPTPKLPATANPTPTTTPTPSTSLALRSVTATTPAPWSGEFTGFPNDPWASQWNGNIDDLFAGTMPVADASMPGAGQALKVHYDAHSSGFNCPDCGTAHGGIQFKGGGGSLFGVSSLYLKYYIKFPVGFDWGLAGKLPGLYGFSASRARLEWHSATGTTHCAGATCGGGLVITGPCTTTEIDVGRGSWSFSADGNWHYVEEYVNSTTGTITVWYDGKQAVTTSSACMTNDTIAGIIFQSFYGGNATKWGPSVPTDVYFGTTQTSAVMIGATPMPSPSPPPTPSPSPTPSPTPTPVPTVPPTSSYVRAAGYLPFGPLTSITFGNGTYQGLFYTSRYLPVGERLTAGTTTLASYSFSEDAVGNIKTVVDNLNAGYDRQYGYDDLNRLTTATSGANLWGTATGDGYRYDAMGNVLNVQLGNTRRAFTYYKGSGNGGNPNSVIPEVSSVTINGVSTPIAFDLAGNNAGGGTQHMYYDAREQMVSTSAQSGGAAPIVQAYLYDGFHQRVATALASGKRRDSIFDSGQHLISETPQFTAGTTPGQPYDYVWFGNRPVAQIDPTGLHWTYADHLGTPFMQTDVSGTPTWRAEYEPYGSVYALRAGDVHQPLRLPGQSAEQFDMGANGFSPLSYNNARWYQPTWGQYTQPDPLGLAGSPRNLYAYAANDPLDSSDPLGLCLVQAAYDYPPPLGKAGDFGNVHETILLTPDSSRDSATGTVAYLGVPEYYPDKQSLLANLEHWSNEGSIFGHVTAQGPVDWKQGRPAYDNWAKDKIPLNLLRDDGLPCACDMARLNQARDNINKMGIPYNPLPAGRHRFISKNYTVLLIDGNSGGVAWYFTRALGIPPPPPPPDLSLPGYGSF